MPLKPNEKGGAITARGGGFEQEGEDLSRRGRI